MIQKYIALLETLGSQHPEHADALNVLTVTMEMLSLAENELDGYMRSYFSPEVLTRESIGTLMDNPLKSADQDIYGPIHIQIVRAMEILGAERTANHLNTVFSRELMLIMGIPQKREHRKAQTKAKHHGETGGQQQKAVFEPLKQEIKRLFHEAIQEKPNLGSKKAYANYIHIDVEEFIQKEPERYSRVGPKDKAIDYPYQRYILDSVKDMKVK